MEEITCPFCDDKGDEALHQDGWTARRCRQCRLVFLSPRPSAADTEALYVDDAAHWPASTHLLDYGSPANRLETARTLRLFRRHGAGKRLLELGPGSGALLSAARAEGYDVSAVELNPAQASFIRDELGIECAESLDAVEGSFDVIYSRDVLSHFSDPIQVFREISERLKPGGLHIFETGNGDFEPRYERLFSTFQFPDHLFFFSERSIALLLERTGFVHVDTARYGLVPFLVGQRILDRLRGGSRERAVGAVEAPDAATGAAGASGAVLARVKYGLRYGAGAFAPKPGRPATLITVARAPR